MAHLAPSRIRAQDNSGNAYSGATLTVYDTGTTTPVELYSTAALAALGGNGDVANPTTGQWASGSDGYFPTLFVNENAVVDVICKTSGGTTLWQALGVEGVPGGDDDIAVDLGDDGRFRVFGAGGIVHMEFGDPLGDDTGGDARIGGWDSTAGTSLEVEFATAAFSGDVTVGDDLTVTGDLTFDGGRTVDLIVGEGTQTSTAGGIIALPTGYEMWDIDLYDIKVGSDNNLRLQFSYDNGVTYKSTAEYKFVASYNTGSTTTAESGSGVGYIQLTSQNANSGPADEASHVRVTIASSALRVTTAFWDGVVYTSVSGVYRISGAGILDADYGVPTHVKVLRGASGTHSYKYMVKARRRRA
jgi:hypothetical protein